MTVKGCYESASGTIVAVVQNNRFNHACLGKSSESEAITIDPSKATQYLYRTKSFVSRDSFPAYLSLYVLPLSLSSHPLSSSALPASGSGRIACLYHLRANCVQDTSLPASATVSPLLVPYSRLSSPGSCSRLPRRPMYRLDPTPQV